MKNKPYFTVFGTNSNGEWTVARGDSGLLCCGTWKTQSDAQNWCDVRTVRVDPWIN